MLIWALVTFVLVIVFVAAWLVAGLSQVLNEMDKTHYDR